MNTSSHLLSKSTFLRGSQCGKSLYLNKFHKEYRDPIDESKQAIFDTGHIVGELAKRLFPGGVDSNFGADLDTQKAINETKRLIDSGIKVIYEAAFMFQECLTVVDILVHDGDCWKAYEVKSSASIKKVNILDISYQYYIIKESGLPLDDIFIVYIDSDYVRIGDLDVTKLFKRESLKVKCEENKKLIEKSVNDFKSILQSSDTPSIDIGEQCFSPYDCDFYGYCWSHIPENSVFDIAGMRMKKKLELYKNGITKLSDIDEDEVSELQLIQIQSHKTNNSRIDKQKIQEFIDNLRYPLYFLDFETINPAIPLYDNTRPYRQIPFQYSLHVLDNMSTEPRHFEFLANSSNDSREQFIISLIEHLQKEGDIIVYNMSFESSRLSELALAFPKYKDEVEAIINRAKDLMGPFREKSYYKPDMNGSYSLKVVLPSLVPEMSYDGLQISNGSSASSAFLYLIGNNIEGKEKEEIRNNLLEYCKLDTLALVRILEVLNKEVV